jgi:hypothetical protein
MRSRIRRLSLWSALLAYLLTGVVSARGLVLCLEPDGHVSVEGALQAPACASCCTSESLPDEPERVDACPCIDIPIGSPDAAPQKKRSAELERASPAAWLAFRPVVRESSARVRVGHAARSRAHASSVLEELATVVLLV